MIGIALEKGKLSAQCRLELKTKLFALRYQSLIADEPSHNDEFDMPERALAP